MCDPGAGRALSPKHDGSGPSLVRISQNYVKRKFDFREHTFYEVGRIRRS
jgi:hypothetical protein